MRRRSTREVLLVLTAACSVALVSFGLGAPVCAAGAGPAWQAPVEIAVGPARRGAWEQNDSDYAWVDDATVDLALDGDALVAWVDQSRKDVFVQRFSGDGRARAPASNVSRTPEVFSWLPRLLVDRADARRVWVLWQEIVFSGGSHGGELYLASSDDGGRSFGAATNLSNSKAGDGKGRLEQKIWDNGSLDLARSDAGALYVAWTEYEGTLWFRRTTDGGKTFEKALAIGGAPTAPARGPSIAAGPGGVVHVAWGVGESDAADIHLATSRDGGRTFDPPRVALQTPGHSDAPRVAVDGAGTVHLVWAERPSKGVRTIQYARRKVDADAFELPRTLSQAGSSGHFPQLGIAGKAVHVAWERWVDERERAQALAYARSTDDGERFTAPSAIPAIASPALGVNGSQQGGFGKKLAVDASGRVAIVNATFRAGESSHVWLLRAK